MANIYVRSTDGSNADNGTTWALAKATLAGADAKPDAAGDTIYVSQAHAESTASAVSLNFAGTPATPSKVLCGNDAAEPPTALATTATVTTTSNATLSLAGSFYCYGITFTADEATTLAADAGGVGVAQEYKNCSFRTTNAGSAGSFFFAGANNYTPRLRLTDCTLKFNATGQKCFVFCAVDIDGGSIVSGSSTPAYLFTFGTDRTQGRLLVSGFNFSNLSSSMVLCNGAGVGTGTMIFRSCKLPASWSGTLITGTIPGPGARYEMHNCDSGDTNYRLWIQDYAGSIKQETTIVRTGGASDGTTSLSWKMATSANAEYPHIRLVSPENAIWNDTTGSSKTLTVEIVHDSQGAGTGSRFRDDEIWLEAMALTTSGFPLGAWSADCKADVLATAADQTDSSETWTTTGLTTPVKQSLSVTFTPQEKGPIIWRVVMAKASKTVYVCPKATLA